MEIDKIKTDQITERSEYFQDILDKIPSKIITWGSSGMLVIFLLLGLGMRYIKYPEVISAQATITNVDPPIDVYSKVSGRISYMLKQNNDNVKQDDWILIINNTSNYNDVVEVDQLVGKLKDGNFWNKLDLIQLDRPFILGDMQNTFSQFARSVVEFRLFKKTIKENVQINISKSRDSKLTTRTSYQKNQLSNANEELKIKKIDLDRANELYEKKVISKAELETKQLTFLNAQQRIYELNESLVNQQLDKELLHKEVNSYHIEKDDQQLKLKNDILQNFGNLEFALSEWKNKYVIASPVDGKIDLSGIRNENQFVYSEKKVFTIIPFSNKKYYCLVKLPINNSGRVNKNQSCIVKLQNYPYEQFGMLKGKISSISLNANEGFYLVMVDLPKQLITTQNKKLSQSGELTGTAEIIIEDLSLFDRLFYSLIRKSY